MTQQVPGFRPGDEMTSGPRKLTEDDLSLLHTLTWSISELHTNRIAMESAAAGERLFAGWCLLAVAEGLHLHAPEVTATFRERGLRLKKTVSTSAQFSRPVVVGDDISVAATVVRSCETGQGAGELEFSFDIRTPDGPAAAARLTYEVSWT